jgi:hypothetical protein
MAGEDTAEDDEDWDDDEEFDDDDFDGDDDGDDDDEDCASCMSTACPMSPNFGKSDLPIGLKYLGELKGSLNVTPATPAPAAAPAPTVAPAPITATPKLCCTVAKSKGYKFCPDCGARL